MDSKLTALFAAVESTYGTPATLTQAILCKVTGFAPYDANMKELDYQQSKYGSQKSIIMSAWARIDVEIDMTGSGTAGTKPLYEMLLRACGLSVIEGSTPDDTVIGLATTGHASATIGYYMDGMLFTMAGCRGNATIGLSPEGFPVFNLTIWGVPVNPQDVTTPDMDFSGYLEPVPINDGTTTFSLFGYSAVLQSLSLDVGFEINRRDKPNDKGVYLRNRKSKGSVTIDLPLVAQKDFFGLIRSHGTGALSAVIGATAGNINTISAPKVQLLGSPSITETDNYVQIGMQLALLPNSDAGDDDLVITQT